MALKAERSLAKSSNFGISRVFSQVSPSESLVNSEPVSGKIQLIPLGRSHRAGKEREITRRLRRRGVGHEAAHLMESHSSHDLDRADQRRLSRKHVRLKSTTAENQQTHPRLTLDLRGLNDNHWIVWRPQGDSNPCYRRERAVSLASRRWGQRENAADERW